MNILILGSGGREHSLAWAIKQNPKCDRLIVAPGNAGIAQIADCADINMLDGDAVAVFAEENAIDFVIIGPEAPLAAGVADRLRRAGLLVFGPSQAAAQLEAEEVPEVVVRDVLLLRFPGHGQHLSVVRRCSSGDCREAT